MLCFRHVLIDEAGQAIEPSCLIPLRFGCERLIMVGDPRQLPATVKSKLTAKFGLERSLFERLEESGYLLYLYL
jgi:senataxin